MFNFQESIGPAYFDKSVEPYFGLISRKFAYNQVSEEIDKQVDFCSLKKLIARVAHDHNYQAIGFDLLFLEKDLSYVLIDVNQYPGATVSDSNSNRTIIERYVNELFLEKKKECFGKFEGKLGFLPGKILKVENETLRFRLAFIHREFRVTRNSGLVPGSYLITAIDGHNQKREEITKGWFQEGYLGRVIKLQSTAGLESGSSTIPLTALILTDDTFEKYPELPVPSLSLSFEDLCDLCDLLREGDLLKYEAV